MHSKTALVELKKTLGNNKEPALLAEPASHLGIAKKLQNFSRIKAPSDPLIPLFAKKPMQKCYAFPADSNTLNSLVSNLSTVE